MMKLLPGIPAIGTGHDQSQLHSLTDPGLATEQGSKTLPKIPPSARARGPYVWWRG